MTKIRRYGLTADLAFLSLLLLLFGSMVYVILTPERQLFNIIAFAVTFAIMMITRFSTLELGFIINIILGFLYMSYLIYDSITSGMVHELRSYAWVLVSPLLTAAVGILSHSTRQIEDEYDTLQTHLEKYTTVDYETGLRTGHAYLQDFEIFQNLGTRNDRLVLLIVWGLRFDRQVRQMLSESETHVLIQKISAAMKDAFRPEDLLYILQKDPLLWGIILLIRPGFEGEMVERIREQVQAIDMRDVLGKRAPKIELRIGYKLDETNNHPPKKILENAIAQMQYDV